MVDLKMPLNAGGELATYCLRGWNERKLGGAKMAALIVNFVKRLELTEKKLISP